MRAAQVSNNVVIHVMIIDEIWLEEIRKKYPDDQIIILDENSPVCNGWVYLDNEFLPRIPTNLEQQENRRIWFEKVSDPLFFKWQRGEIPQEPYLDSIQNIKDSFPYFYDEDGTLDLNFYKAFLENRKIIPESTDTVEEP